MYSIEWAYAFMLTVFVLGYLAIIFEYNIKVNKTAAALVMAVLTWSFLFLTRQGTPHENTEVFLAYVGEVSQIIFFLLGAMTLVELIDSHKGFQIITNIIHTRSKKKLLWTIGIFSFFLSAVLDNLTTTVLMISLLRKLIPDPKERLLLGATVVICANAGGAWTPIGDVTTTMLWIDGRVTSLAVISSLFIPSLSSMVVTLLLLGLRIKGNYHVVQDLGKQQREPGSNMVFCFGVGGLIFVPVFKAFTGLPPFMGMLISLGVLWFITDIMHHKYENRHHLRVPHILTRIDTSGVLFFLGILLTIHSLDSVGILKDISKFLEMHVQNLAIISTLIGIISAVVDNVPLVAATMGMYDVSIYPPDSALWLMIAYCAGTGGSILIIGSAAGVALMGMEKVDFIWYLKKISLTALTGYLAGMVVYLLIYGLIL